MPLKQRVRVNKTLRQMLQDLHLHRTRTRAKKKRKDEQSRNNFSNSCENMSSKIKSISLCKSNKCDQKHNLVNIHIHLFCHIHCKVKSFGKEINMQNIYPSNLIIKTRFNQFPCKDIYANLCLSKILFFQNQKERPWENKDFPNKYKMKCDNCATCTRPRCGMCLECNDPQLELECLRKKCLVFNSRKARILFTRLWADSVQEQKFLYGTNKKYYKPESHTSKEPSPHNNEQDEIQVRLYLNYTLKCSNTKLKKTKLKGNNLDLVGLESNHQPQDKNNSAKEDGIEATLNPKYFNNYNKSRRSGGRICTITLHLFGTKKPAILVNSRTVQNYAKKIEFNYF